MPKAIPDAQPKIIDAAAELFSATGYRSVDMRSVARRAGVSVGTLYNHYPDKAALFAGIVESLYRALHDSLGAEGSMPTPGTDRAVWLVERLYGFIGQHMGLWSPDGAAPDPRRPVNLMSEMAADAVATLSQAMAEARGVACGAWSDRAGSVVAAAIADLASRFDSADGENLAFLRTLVMGLIQVHQEA